MYTVEFDNNVLSSSESPYRFDLRLHVLYLPGQLFLLGTGGRDAQDSSKKPYPTPQKKEERKEANVTERRVFGAREIRVHLLP